MSVNPAKYVVERRLTMAEMRDEFGIERGAELYNAGRVWARWNVVSACLISDVYRSLEELRDNTVQQTRPR